MASAPKDVHWRLEPHSRAKHAILRRYLQAWMPILGNRFPEIVYLDGFAGPGQFNGEDGSPLIALKAALNRNPPIESKIHFVFVEEKKARADHLRSLLEKISLPANFSVKVQSGVTFAGAYGELRHPPNGICSRGLPTFGFLDPFGWTGIPFEIVADIIKNRNGEVLVTFMFEEVNRFLSKPDQAGNFDKLFGCEDWRTCQELKDRERYRCILDVYIRQLKKAGAEHVRTFEMRNDRDVTDYHLIFATHSLKGLAKMKEAMWKVDETGEFKFSDATDPNQLVLFAKEPDYEALERLVYGHFTGKTVTCHDVETFVVAETAFRETHYRKVLKRMEETSPPRLKVVNPKEGRRRGSFPDPKMRLTFS